MTQNRSKAVAARSGEEPVLDERYLRAIERVEALPQNRSGSDKTWVDRALDEFRRHHSEAVQR